MSLGNYSGVNCVLYINGRQISAFGQSDSPITLAQLSNKSTLLRGMNGNALKHTVINEGYSLAVALLPSSEDSKFISSQIQNTTADIIATYVTISTGESVVLTEGIFTTMGDLTRGGTSVSDDVYNFEFNIGVVTKGSL